MGAWSVRSAHTRAVLGAAAAAAVLAASIGSLPASATGAAKKGTGVWTKISTPKVSGIDEPGVLRLKDGRLLVVYYREAPSGNAGYGSTIVTAKGKVASTGTVLSNWDTLVHDPKPIRISGSRVSVVFSGIRKTTPPGDPYNQGSMYSLSAPASAASWSLDTTGLSTSKSAYGSYGTGALVLPDGTPVVSFPLGGDITWRTGFDPSIPSGGTDKSFATGGCCAYKTSLAHDSVSDETFVSWYSNASAKADNGTFVRRLLPSLGPITKDPGSSVGSSSLPNDQATALESRLGAAGTYAAYCVGYPSCKHVVLWRLGTAKAKIVPHSKNAHHVALAAGPGGRMWVLWDGYGSTRVYAVHTNPAATKFGAVHVIATPKASGVYTITGEGSASRKLDIVINTGTALYTTQVLPSLTFAAKPGHFRSGHRTVVTFSVTDAGAPVANARVSVNGKSARTNAKGKASFAFGAKTKPGRYRAKVNKRGFYQSSLIVRVTH